MLPEGPARRACILQAGPSMSGGWLVSLGYGLKGRVASVRGWDGIALGRVRGLRMIGPRGPPRARWRGLERVGDG